VKPIFYFPFVKRLFQKNLQVKFYSQIETRIPIFIPPKGKISPFGEIKGGCYLLQTASISSSVFPLVSGTIFQTKKNDKILIIP